MIIDKDTMIKTIFLYSLFIECFFGCIIFIPLIGIGFSIILLIFLVLITILIKNFFLKKEEKKKDLIFAEIRDIPYLSGYIMTTDYYYIDFGIKQYQDYDELINSDKVAEKEYNDIKNQIGKISFGNYKVYRIYPISDKKLWNSSYIIMILPATFTETFDFKSGYIGYKGYSVSMDNVTLFSAFDISIDNIPKYVVYSSDYDIKKYKKLLEDSKSQLKNK